MAGKPIRLGIDLGGSKTEIIALDSAGSEQFRERRATPQGTHGSIGIGTPGALSPATGLLRNSNSVCLNGLPFKTDDVVGGPINTERPFTA